MFYNQFMEKIIGYHRVTEVAAILGVHKKAVNTLVERGRLRAVKVERDLLIPEVALDDLKPAHTGRPPTWKDRIISAA